MPASGCLAQLRGGWLNMSGGKQAKADLTIIFKRKEKYERSKHAYNLFPTEQN